MRSPVKLLASALLCALASACTPKPEVPSRAAEILKGESLPARADVVELSGVSIDRFERDRVRYRAHAGEARIDRSARRIDGTHVRIEDDAGRTISSDEMTYDAAKEEITAPGPVTVAGKNFRATGGRLVAKTSTGTIEVEGPLRATVD